MSKTHILITNDTGPMHVASACSTKVISIHIGKEKCVSTGPYGEGHIALHPKLVCHPCKKPEECPTKSCRDLIAPGLVFEMVKFLLKDKTELSSADVKTEMKKADVFISGFDESGLLDFFPLWKSELTLSILCSRFLRFMWDLSLSYNLADSELYGSIDRSTDGLISIIERHYFIEDIVSLKNRWEKAYRSLENLTVFAQHGSLLARKIQQTAYNAVKNIQALQELSEEIEKLDEKIISLGETFREIATLTHMFSFEKESLYGDHVIDLAGQTDSIYRKLLRRCKILKEIGNSFFDKLPVTDNIEKMQYYKDAFTQIEYP